MRFAGVDPGWSGGFCVLTANGIETVAKTADDDPDLLAQFELLKGCRVALERVGGFVGRNQPGSRMFTFGWSYGRLKMAVLAATGTEPETPTPQVWQKALGIDPRRRSEGETDSAFKRRLAEFARAKFPGVSITLATADAVLLALYCREKFKGSVRTQKWRVKS